MAGPLQTTNERILYSQGGQEAGQFGYHGLPPEEALAQRALARKQQIANIMMMKGQEQAGQNHGQMVGRFYVPGSWAQNTAGLGQMLAGLYGSHIFDQQSEDVQKQQGDMRANALQDYIQKTTAQQIPEHALPQGSPDVPASPGNLSDVLGDAHPAMGTPQMRQVPTGMANRLFPSAPAAEAPVDYQPPTEGQAAVPATEGPVNPAMTIQPNPAVARVAQAQLATSTDPYLRQYAMAEAQRQAQAAEHGMNREFLTAQNADNRQNRLDVAQQGFGKDMVLATMMGASKEQIEKLQSIHAQQLEQVKQGGANQRDNVQSLVVEDKQSPTGWSYADARTGKIVMPGAPLPASTVKANAQGQKALPSAVGSKFMENSQNLRMAERAQGLMGGQTVEGVKGDPNATGFKNYLPDAILQRTDPTGVETRAAVANLGSLIIHDRSGAAVTASEYPRLKPFIPTATDDPATVKKKLGQFINEYTKINEEMTQFYTDAGYNVPQSDWHQSPEVTAPEAAGVAPFNDAEKERRYQEFKANHK